MKYLLFWTLLTAGLCLYQMGCIGQRMDDRAMEEVRRDECPAFLEAAQKAEYLTDEENDIVKFCMEVK